jgi:glycosyltransferase involved in cell wall biosynthesis
MIKKISILGTVGVPAAYGGFETLVDNLVVFANQENLPISLSVYCSGREGPRSYQGAELRYVNLNANGISSIFYDIVSLFSAINNKDKTILLLGVSGAIILPVIRLITNVKIICNIDGVEWKRDKWSSQAKLFLRFSEYIAVKFSHQVITDNEGIAEHVRNSYSRDCNVIAYGGDHAITAQPKAATFSLPDKFALALCRIEPENNIEMILQAFSNISDVNLVFIGNWKSSAFALEMLEKYSNAPNLYLLDPIYDTGVLRGIRSMASYYVHGHSAGGTNPSLVEMMHFGTPAFAYDCNFNRYTTDNCAIYFSDAQDLRCKIKSSGTNQLTACGSHMTRIAKEKYTWNKIGRQYFELMLG